ncbi:SCP-like extracellular protein [Colletotrichum tofieldiae]|nr:SCP-like extracellular protein [Colletotrichum tofieldiae]GKT94759.1 SCP-like extracellular protein [Colletotrichum tofieldiae]
MHFSAGAAVGLGLLSVHVEAIVVPVRDALFPDTTVTVVSTASPVTVTVTATPLPVTVTTTLSSLLSTTLSNSTNSTTTSSTTSTSTTSSISTILTFTSTTSAISTILTFTSTTSAISTILPTNPPTSGLTADQQRALDLHNKYRADVGNAALTWDNDLAKSAQVWADHLTTVGGLEHDKNPGGQGENLALQSGGTSTFYANAVQLWLDEKSLYDNQPIRADGSPNYLNYGHYTQAIWKSTTKVGLALATDAKGTTYVVARYLPPGN